MKVVEIKFDFLMTCLYVYEDGKLLGEYCDFYENKKINSISGSLETLYNTCITMDEHFKTTTINKEKIALNKSRFLHLLNELNRLLEENSDGKYIVKDLETPKIKMM